MSDRKDLPTPRVIFLDTGDFSGCFYARRIERCVDDWLDIDRSEADYIVLSTHWGDVSGSTIAHEHRHLQQYYSLVLPQLPKYQMNVVNVVEGLAEADWSREIRRYYLTQPWEMDALRYSMKTHLDEHAEEQWAACFETKPYDNPPVSSRYISFESTMISSERHPQTSRDEWA